MSVQTSKKRNVIEEVIAESECDDDILLEREISEFRAAGRPLDTKGFSLLAKTACENSGYASPDHFVEVTEMIELAKGTQRQERR